MLKNFLLYLSCLSLVLTLGACTSKNVENEEGDVAELGVDEFGDAETGGAGIESDPFAEDAELEDLGSGDLAPAEPFADDGSDPFAAEGADPFADSGDAGGEADPFAEESSDPFADSGDTGSGADPFAEAPAADEFADSSAEPSDDFGSTIPEPVVPEISEPAEMADSTYSEESYDSPYTEDTAYSGETAEKSWVPVKKIADAPFEKSGVLVNAVYLARPGDDMAAVSAKIYGADKTEDLYKVNPHFRNRGLKVGDKVYYNSPNRPDDNSKLLTFYEDVGLAPETYISQEGDNIRAVSKNLLGDENSWKEVWATNPNVESKGELASGVQLRYWTSDVSTSAPAVAAVTPPPTSLPPQVEEPEPEFEEEEEMASNDMPPPMPEEASMEEEEPMDMPEEEMAANDLPPPPPPSARVMEPPPPPPPPTARSTPPPQQAEAMEQDQVMMLGAGAILLLAAVALFIARKKRAKRQLDFNTTTQTQIE